MPPTSKEFQSKESLNRMAERVSGCADRLRYIGQQMESYGLEKIEVKRYKSWRDGMPMVEKFVESANEAFFECLEQLGQYNASGTAPKKKGKK